MADTNKSGNQVIRFTENIRSSFRLAKAVTMLSVVSTAVVVIASYMYCANVRREASQQPVYIIDQGSALAADRAANEAQKDLEVLDHLKRFHEFMFNVAPSVTAINSNMTRALEMADESAYNYFLDQKENRYYSKMIDVGASQVVDSVNVAMDVKSYPYRAECQVYFSLIRKTSITQYMVTTSCSLENIPRTAENAHGLLIKDFYASAPVRIVQNRRSGE